MRKNGGASLAVWIVVVMAVLTLTFLVDFYISKYMEIVNFDALKGHVESNGLRDLIRAISFGSVEVVKGLSVALLVTLMFDYFEGKKMKGVRGIFATSLRSQLCDHRKEVFWFINRMRMYDRSRRGNDQLNQIQIQEEISSWRESLSRLEDSNQRLYSFVGVYLLLLTKKENVNIGAVLDAVLQNINQIKNIFDSSIENQINAQRFINEESNAISTKVDVINENCAKISKRFDDCFSSKTVAPLGDDYCRPFSDEDQAAGR